MIVTTVAHGRTAGDTARLITHLDRQDAQLSRVVSIDWSAGRAAAEALRVMERARDAHPRALVAFHHITLNPGTLLTDDQRNVAVERIAAALGAEEHPRVVWQHAEHPRAGPGGAPHHWHIVLGHVGPDGRCLDMSHSYARLEAVARTLELDLGEKLTPTRRPRSVTIRLRTQGREDVARAVEAAQPNDLPRSSMTSSGRARADRLASLSPAEARQAVREAVGAVG